MKNVYVLLAFVLFTGVSSFGQAVSPIFRIKGKIIDSQGQALPSASVSVLKARDSSLVKMGVAQSTGEYQIDDVAAGKYLLSVSAVGYLKTYSAKFESPSSGILEMEPIRMAPASKDLKEVTVVARKNLIEQKIDRTVINVDAAITNAGTSALEVLEKSPGVQVDKDGNISLKGKQGVTILIDGRPTYLSGAELASMLKGMESSQLDQIEIMTNPPAKYDAAGNSGIINIKTKKNKTKGFNGNITIGGTAGKYFKTNESIGLNYRTSKMNIFANYSYGYNDNFQQLDLYRRFKTDEGDTRAIFEQTSLMKFKRINHNLKMGMDYYLNKKTTLGVVLTGFYNPMDATGSNTSYLKNASLQTDSIVQSNSAFKELWKNGGINLNMRHAYDSTGHELTMDVDAIKYNSSNIQDFANITYNPSWVKKLQEDLRGNLPVKIDIYSAKVDYTRPLKNEAKLEMGWKSSYVNTDSKAKYEQLQNDEWMPDYGKINYFEYKENINAAYVNLNRKLSKKITMQTGLRFENTNYSGLQYGNPTRADSSFHHTYNGLFPTVYLSYNADKNNQFSISGGRRIDRPRYEDLNPFMFFIDKYTYGRGNPYLKPQYSNNFELSHIFKGMLTTTLNYSVTKDLFSEIFDQEGDYATLVRQGNIGKRTNAGISVSTQLKLAKWLSTNLYTNYNYNTFKGQLFGEYLKVSGGNLTANMSNQFSFNKGWSAELSGWYRSKGIEGQVLIFPMGELSTGIAKQVMKGKGSIKLSIRDIFYTQGAKGEINFKSTEAHFQNHWDSRNANITFTYRFGKPTKGNTPQRREHQNEEQNRVKSGS